MDFGSLVAFQPKHGASEMMERWQHNHRDSKFHHWVGEL